VGSIAEVALASGQDEEWGAPIQPTQRTCWPMATWWSPAGAG